MTCFDIIAAGVERGQRVLVFMPDCVERIFVVLACFRLGAPVGVMVRAILTVPVLYCEFERIMFSSIPKCTTTWTQRRTQKMTEWPYC